MGWASCSSRTSVAAPSTAARHGMCTHRVVRPPPFSHSQLSCAVPCAHFRLCPPCAPVCRSFLSARSVVSRSHLALHDELVSKAFQGRHGRAFLFGNVSAHRTLCTHLALPATSSTATPTRPLPSPPTHSAALTSCLPSPVPCHLSLSVST